MTSESIEADVPSLVRAAKLILGPVYLWDYTPDLLGMIAQIELWHQTIISRAEIALAANNNLIQYPYHDDGSPRGRCFLDSDRKALEDISDPNSVAARRKKYFMCTTALRREVRE